MEARNALIRTVDQPDFSRTFFLLGAACRLHFDNDYATLNFLIWPQRLPEFPFLREGTPFRLIRDHMCLRGRFLASFEAGGSSNGRWRLGFQRPLHACSSHLILATTSIRSYEFRIEIYIRLHYKCYQI